MIKKGLIAGVANLLVGIVLSFGFQTVIPGLAAEYQTADLFRPWTDPLMMIYFAYPFIAGIALAYLWQMLGKQLTGNPVNKAVQFAKLYFIIATIPGMFITYTSFQISLAMIASWTLVGLVEAFVAGLVFTRIK